MTTLESITRIQSLRAQAFDLRDPARKSRGPSRFEAEECAASLEREADELSEGLYWEQTRAMSEATSVNVMGESA